MADSESRARASVPGGETRWSRFWASRRRNLPRTRVGWIWFIVSPLAAATAWSLLVLVLGFGTIVQVLVWLLLLLSAFVTAALLAVVGSKIRQRSRN